MRRAHFRLPWPLPALAVWTGSWMLYLALRDHAVVAFGVASALGVGLAVVAGSTRWRRLFVALGFPLSLAASGLVGGLPAWSWLVPLALLAAFYPLNAWRDAPLFPTPVGALAGLTAAAPLPPGAGVLDAGCGLGAGLLELRLAYPEVRLTGVEWSWPLAWLCHLRCGGIAQVGRGDMWTVDWSAHAMVYLFQRPESMERAWAKARRELAPGSWLASLEFQVDGVRPARRLDGDGGKPVWLYRV